VKLIGLSANTVETHGGWINDIDGEFKSLHVYHAGSRDSQKNEKRKKEKRNLLLRSLEVVGNVL
jgi:hypothetical protein